MRKLIMISLFVFVATSSVSAEVYRWVDSTGKISYSDVPQPGAEEVKISKQPSPSNKSEVNDELLEDSESGENKTEVINYKIRILTPENDEAIRDNAGNVSVMVKVSPKLAPEDGNEFIIYLDDVASPDRHSNLFFTLQNIERGTHNLRVDLVDKDEKVLTSVASTFHLKRFSVQH